MDRFEELLKELGQIINFPLHVDKNRACLLNFNGNLRIQMEMEHDRLLLSSFVCPIPAGRFREDVLKEALKANDQFPRVGNFAYVRKNNQLAVFEYLPTANLTGEKLGEFLAQFVNVADQWRVAVEGGAPGPTPNQPKSRVGDSIFEIKP